VACLWEQWPIYGGSGLSMAAACSWRRLVYRGYLFVEALFIEAARSWR
jgi:hypothetical protein